MISYLDANYLLISLPACCGVLGVSKQHVNMLICMHRWKRSCFPRVHMDHAAHA